MLHTGRPVDVRTTHLEPLEGRLLLSAADDVIRIDAIPGDTHFTRQWALHNTGQTGGTVDADIDAPEAWNLSIGSTSVVVGVIDSGIDYTHPDLAGNIWRNPGEVAGDGIDNDANGYIDDLIGWDFHDNDNDPMDENGHGTHVAGTIAAGGNNAMGVTGVNWNAQVMALKFMDPDGAGSRSAAIEAIDYATMMRQRYGVNVRVLNSSWGGGEYSPAMHQAINRASRAGILFVAAAGNGGADGIGDNNDRFMQYPANYPSANVISVAASNHKDGLARFSNRGGETVHIAAPGVNILSTVPGGYASFSGTSMAAPHVSGVAALLFARAPQASVGQVRSAILTGVDARATLEGRTAAGGRLNAFKAIRAFKLASTPAITPTAVSAASATADAPRTQSLFSTRPIVQKPEVVAVRPVDTFCVESDEPERFSSVLVGEGTIG